MAILEGTDNADVLTAAADGDILIGKGGNDTLNGGGRFAFVAYWTSPSAVGVQLFSETANDGFGGTDRLFNIHGVFGSAFNDVILGSALTDVLSGLDGDDNLQGLDGDDVLDGGQGNDSIDGGVGNDTANFNGNRSDYTVTASGSGFIIVDNRPGSDGTDTVVNVEAFQFADGTLTADNLLTGSPAGGVTGTPGGDRLADRPGDTTIDGLGGYDWLDLQGSGYRGGQVSPQADGSLLLVHAGETDTLRHVEEVRFLDGRLVLDQAAPAAQVVRLYQAALGRTPDQGGLDGWTALLESGTPLSAAAQGFLASPEFQSRFSAAAGPDDAAFIEQLYQNVLHRPADPEGRANWLAILADQRLDRAGVLAGFAESAENQANTAPLTSPGVWLLDPTAAALARLYDTVLGRLPDLPGLAGWKALIESGTLDLKGAAQGFMGSAEFQQQFGGLGHAAFVETLYQHSLHRPADPAGKAGWTGALEAQQLDRADVVLGFSESPEHIANTAPAIMSPNPAEYGILFA